MKVTLEATDRIENIRPSSDGRVPARIWKGKTESGIEVVCWISVVQVSKDADNAQFERELSEIKVERELVSFDMRMV